MKKCSRCKQLKDYKEFHKHTKHQDGLSCWCKECNCQLQKKYYQEHKAEKQEYSRQYRKKHGKSVSYREKQRIRWKRWHVENEEEYNKRRKQRYQENKPHINSLQRKRYKKQMEDPDFKIMMNLRERLRRSIKVIRNKVNIDSVTQVHKKLLGCSLRHLKEHLESQFQQGMTWDNYGDWHIDHIRPITSFDLLKEEDRKACFHYTNLQPLWAQENIKKGGKWIPKTSSSNTLEARDLEVKGAIRSLRAYVLNIFQRVLK